MAQTETWGERCGSYSAWHRIGSIKRYVGCERAQLLSMCDVDVAVFLEWDDGSKEPLALVEIAIDRGQAWKATTVMRQLARRANLPAFCVLYSRSAWPNPADQRFLDIDRFRVRRIWPDEDADWTLLTPEEWALALLQIREDSARALDEARANKRYVAGTQ